MTSGAILIALTNVAILLTALVALYEAVRASRQAVKAAERNEIAIQQVHVLINSRMDELLKAQEKIAFAAGVASGKREQTP